MNTMVCVSVSVYRDELTRGKQYDVLAIDGDKRKIRIQGDNGRTRWFPSYCFDQSNCSVPTLDTFNLDDPIMPNEDSPIEVTVQLSNGERRWCIFATPSALANCGYWIEGTQIPFHYGNRHVIIAKELSEDLILRMLHEIDRQGALVDCTVPLDDVDDELESVRQRAVDGSTLDS